MKLEAIKDLGWILVLEEGEGPPIVLHSLTCETCGAKFVRDWKQVKNKKTHCSEKCAKASATNVWREKKKLKVG